MNDLESALSDIQKTKKLLEKIEILEEASQAVIFTCTPIAAFMLCGLFLC